MTCRSAVGLRTLASVLLPAILGGCACLSPVLEAADFALTAALGADAPRNPAHPASARVKGFSQTATKAEGRNVRQRPSAAPRRRVPQPDFADAATAADQSDAAAIASEAERLATAEAIARASSEKAVADAHAMMLKGEVQAARQRLVAAMNGSNALVVLAFARTFDPQELAKLGKADATPDIGRAQALYEHARQLGSKDAEAALKRLAATRAPEPKGGPASEAPVSGGQNGAAKPATAVPRSSP